MMSESPGSVTVRQPTRKYLPKQNRSALELLVIFAGDFAPTSLCPTYGGGCIRVLESRERLPF